MPREERASRTYLNLKIKGLNTFQSDLSEVPIGALQVADNLIIDKEGILETRRGIRDRLTVPSVVPEANPFIRSFHQYGENLLMHVESFKEDEDGFVTKFNYMYYTDSDTREPVRMATLTPPPEETGNIFSTEFRSNFFFTHDDGIFKIDRIEDRVNPAGVTKGIALDYGISEVLDVDAVELISNSREQAIETVATREEDPFEIKISKDQNVDLIGDRISVNLTFENSFIFAFDPSLYEVFIPADSGFNGRPGVYPILSGGNGSITISSEAVDIPEVDYTLPAGELDLLEDTQNPNNIIIKLPPGSPPPPAGLIDRQLRIETGTFDDSPPATLDILAVTDETITIRNLFGWEPSEFIIPEDSELRISIPDDAEHIVIHNPPRKLNASRRPTMTFPATFLEITADLVVSGSDVRLNDAGDINIFNELLASKQDVLLKATENLYTLLAGQGFEVFCTFEKVWLKLPIRTDGTNVEASEDITGYNIKKSSTIEIPESSIPINPTNSQTILNSTEANVNIDEIIYNTGPTFDNGDGDIARGSLADREFVWVGITKNYDRDSGDTSGLFAKWGNVKELTNVGAHINMMGKFYDANLPANEIELRGSATSPLQFGGINTDLDWIIVPPNTYNNDFHDGDDKYLSDQLIGPISPSSDASYRLRFKIHNTLSTKWFPFGDSRFTRFHSNKIITVLRPPAEFNPSKNIIIRTEPDPYYKFPVPVHIEYTEGRIVANKPIQIGRFSTSRRLNTNLSLYKKVDDSLSSDRLTTFRLQTFTLESTRVNGLELRGEENRNLRVYVSPALTQDEADIISRGTGTSTEGIIDIPTGTSLAGLTNTAVTISGASGNSFTLRLTDDQIPIVQNFLNNVRGLLTNDLDFTYLGDGPSLQIAFTRGDPLEKTIRLVYEQLVSDQEKIFDELIQKANRIFIPESSTFLGIAGIAFFDILDYKRQTETDGAEITISTAGFNYDDLVAERSPYHKNKYIFGDFNIGVLNSFDALNENNLALQSDGQYSYRIVWSFEDSKNNLIVGEPSEALIVRRDLGQRPVNIDLVVTVPAEIVEHPDIDKFKYEIYRSSRSANAESTPLGNEALVISNNIPTDVNGVRLKRFAVTDELPDNSRGKALYTNVNQEGIEGANMRPPRALDIAAYREHLMFANTEHKPILELQLNSVEPQFLKEGDQFSISPQGLSEHSMDLNRVIFHASTKFEGLYLTDPDQPSLEARNYFKISDNETDSVAIEETTKSLIRVINLYARLNFDIRAHYLSTIIDEPGRFILTYDRTTDRKGFSVQSNAGMADTSSDTTWSPSILESTKSEVDPQRNALYFSKYREPEAVPALNFLRIGSSTEPILRIIPLRESLFVFKTDGVFRITGDNPRNLTVEPFDLTIKLLAPKSAVSLANMIICLTNQGIVSITDNGLRIESRPIEDTIQKIINSPDVAKCFAVAYETDRKYILNLPNNKGEIEEQYVLNIITKGWTRWTLAAISGTIWQDRLIIGNGAKIRQERKSGTESDYQDEFDEPIKTRVEWTTIHANTPDKTKHFPEIRVMFKQAPVDDERRPYATFTTDQSLEEERVPLHFVHVDPAGFGAEPWGQHPYGSPRPKREAVSRTYVPRHKQKAALLHLGIDHESLKDKMELTGLAVSVRDLSKRTDR